MPQSEKDFEAESDLRTLVEADRIRKDAKRLKAAKGKARTQLAALKKV